ncbi:non-muscle caldesmon isoform X1 [Chiloscyllium plagiosum]|uniref:non-muscle caldesmon isoform X1 n=1 Tax=Chiloscyllium plagiosum TaxID=36176 RepID=UPI001CB8124F|nr:non-muscle caldesmon isoform X1 [Chiloscyllium plagiosum]
MDDLEHRRELRRQKREELWRQAERLTAQRSMEDEEEIARERRRRARDERRYDQDDNGSFTSSTSSTPVFESLSTTAENQYNFNYKSTNSALDEDEGFSDWTQRREERRQKRREELSQIEKDHVDESQTDRAYALRDRKGLEDQEGPSVCKLKMWQIEEEERKMHQRQQREQEEEEENRQRRAHERQQREMEEMERAQKYLDEKDRFKYEREEKERLNLDSMQKERRKLEVEKRPKDNEVKMSHTATAWTEHSCYEEENNDMIQDKMASFHGYRATKTMLSEFPETDEDGELTRLEAEQKLEQIRRSLDEKENLEYERLRQRGHDAELELEELKKRREDRRKLREEEEQRRQQQELEEQAREEEEKRRMREEREKRRMEAAEKRQKVLSISGSEMEDPFIPLSPKSPTFKNEYDEGMTPETTCLISERTESLNRSLKKSNSIKKTQPITNISKIDERLEQYTSAIESTTKSLRHTSLDMPNLPEDVATKKNLWESGDVAGYSVAKGTPCKDTDGLKVGVCDLINQWVSKNPESNTKASPSKPAEIKVGDVRSKKNIWENKGDSHSITKSQHTGKNHPSGTRYKFVVVGHGMYEKIPITDDENGTDQNSQSSEVEHFIEEH